MTFSDVRPLVEPILHAQCSGSIHSDGWLYSCLQFVPIQLNPMYPSHVSTNEKETYDDNELWIVYGCGMRATWAVNCVKTWPVSIGETNITYIQSNDDSSGVAKWMYTTSQCGGDWRWASYGMTIRTRQCCGLFAAQKITRLDSDWMKVDVAYS